jgi:hypothetical protein
MYVDLFRSGEMPEMNLIYAPSKGLDEPSM